MTKEKPNSGGLDEKDFLPWWEKNRESASDRGLPELRKNPLIGNLAMKEINRRIEEELSVYLVTGKFEVRDKYGELVRELFLNKKFRAASAEAAGTLGQKRMRLLKRSLFGEKHKLIPPEKLKIKIQEDDSGQDDLFKNKITEKGGS